MSTGIEQSKKVVDVVADVGAAMEKVVADKGSVFSKISHLVPLSGDLVEMAGVDFSQVKQELADLDDAEKQQLLDEFKTKFTLDDGAIETHIEEALAIALAAEELIERVVSFSKSLHAPAPTV